MSDLAHAAVSLLGDGQSSLPEEVRRVVTGMGRLIDVTSELAGTIDPATILQAIANEACAALDCERASLYRYDARQDELYTSVTTRLEINEIRRPAGHGITGTAAREQKVIHVPDPPADPRWNDEFDRLTGFQTKNILAGPLTAAHDGELLGVLQLLNRRRQAFDAIDEQLFAAFCEHAAVALERVAIIEERTRQQQVRASLEVARTIQQGFMPRKLPSVPRYELASWWAATDGIGGDYCDVLPLTDGRLGLAIADVSGHGLGPSLLMASLRAGLHALVLEHSAPEVLLNLLSRSLAGDLPEGRFITMAMAALDLRANSLEFANAGHAPALHVDAATGDIRDLEPTGVPLGVVARPEYTQGWPIDLDVGDLVLLCTDGIVEAMNHDDEQFGRARLDRILRRSAASPLEEVVETIGAAVGAHHGTGSPADDLTILALRRSR